LAVLSAEGEAVAGEPGVGVVTSRVEDPGSLKSPQAELNTDAEPGKFRYDREFLMQFMSVCREKPDNLPPLEEIGLEAESSSGFGTRGGRGGRRNDPNSPIRKLPIP
jgi:translation initiation factor 4G